MTKQQDNQLFALGAIQRGLAINDQNGVININTDIGQAFYKDSTGTILNYGKINLFGNPMDESDSHMGVAPDDKDVLSELSGSGESISKTTTADGFIAVNDPQTMATKRLMATLQQTAGYSTNLMPA